MSLDGDVLEASLMVDNGGRVSADDLVQVYFRAPKSASERPPNELDSKQRCDDPEAIRIMKSAS